MEELVTDNLKQQLLNTGVDTRWLYKNYVKEVPDDGHLYARSRLPNAERGAWEDIGDVGNDPRVGNLNDLKTRNKNTIVRAINEVFDHTYYSVLLDFDKVESNVIIRSGMFLVISTEIESTGYLDLNNLVRAIEWHKDDGSLIVLDTQIVDHNTLVPGTTSKWPIPIPNNPNVMVQADVIWLGDQVGSQIVPNPTVITDEPMGWLLYQAATNRYLYEEIENIKAKLGLVDFEQVFGGL